MATSAEIRQHLVDALGLDLIGPDWDDTARRHEHLPQPPSVWYTTGFLVPHVFEQEAGRTTENEQLSFADLAGEEPSNGASNRLEKQEKDDDANDALDQANTRRSWFPPPWPELHPGEGLHLGGHRHLGGLQRTCRWSRGQDLEPHAPAANHQDLDRSP